MELPSTPISGDGAGATAGGQAESNLLESTVSPPLPSTSVFVAGSAKRDRSAFGGAINTVSKENVAAGLADFRDRFSNSGSRNPRAQGRRPFEQGGNTAEPPPSSLTAAERALRASHEQLEKVLLADEASPAHRKGSTFSSSPLTRAEPEFYSGLSERQQEAMRHERQLADVHAYYREVIEDEKSRAVQLEKE